MRAVVIGAGYAGLSAAYRLQKAGWEVVVLEKEDVVGGRASTLRKDGFALERGATQIASGWQELMALAKEFGLEGELAPSTNIVTVIRKGKLYDIDSRKPWTAAFSNFLPLSSKIRMLRAARDYMSLDPAPNVLDLSEMHALDRESCREYARRRLDDDIYNVLIDPMIRAYVLSRGDDISVIEWFSLISNLSGTTFYGMRGGSDRLPRLIASKLDVRTGVEVVSARKTPRGVEVIYRDAANAEHRLECDGCVVATKLPDTVRIAPEIAEAARPLAARLVYSRNFNVQLGFDRLPNRDTLGVLVPTVEHPHVMLLWLEHNKHNGCAPPGHALISVHMDEVDRGSLLPGDDEHLIQIAKDYLERLFPELSGHNVLCEVTRWDAAIPKPTTGTYNAINKMKQQLDPADPIQIAGDYFTCTGQNSAVHWGGVAASNLLTHIGRSNAQV